MATIYERIRKVTIEQLGVGEEEVSATSNFASDLGADSLDLVELIMALEEEFSTPEKKVSIPDEDAEKIVTVQDTVDYIRKLGISDYQSPAKPLEKAGPRINLPKPSFHKPGITKESSENTAFQAGNSPRTNQFVKGKQSDYRFNQPRRDNKTRPGNQQRPVQPQSKNSTNPPGNQPKT